MLWGQQEVGRREEEGGDRAHGARAEEFEAQEFMGCYSGSEGEEGALRWLSSSSGSDQKALERTQQSRGRSGSTSLVGLLSKLQLLHRLQVAHFSNISDRTSVAEKADAERSKKNNRINVSAPSCSN